MQITIRTAAYFNLESSGVFIFVRPFAGVFFILRKSSSYETKTLHKQSENILTEMLAAVGNHRYKITGKEKQWTRELQ